MNETQAHLQSTSVSVPQAAYNDKGLVFARRWCWRQSDASAAQLDTTEAIITVESQHVGGRTDIEAAQADLLTLLKEYAGGTYTTGILDADNPRLAD